MRRVGLAFCIVILTGCSRMSATSPLPATSQARTSSSNFQVLHTFEKPHNGIVPVGALVARNGVLYGTTNFGGDASKDCYPAKGCGTVYEVSMTGKETVLYRFAGTANGTRPYAGLVAVNGTFYGTTQTGGKRNEGTVFAITTSGSEDVIFAFDGKDGNDPRANLTSVSGVLYGTTYEGGSAGTGTIFTVTTSGAAKVLHSFTGGGTDGTLPLGTLISVNNVLYGTTSAGGTSNAGTVFKINPDGTNYGLVYSFKGGKIDGAFPFAGLTEMNGALYGTTQKGGTHNKGTVFAITASDSESVLHSFGQGTDGSEPFAGLTVLKGQLYGTTAYGGSTTVGSYPRSAFRKPSSEGTIYTITPSGSEQVLHSFTGGPGGRVPYSNLTAVGGALYGTTIWGGNAGLKGGTGTLFEYSP
ncbi:MAG: choice-of-anchor tandem repeat GloVer-containing protein [Candidatus Baltobacteraceae bacterium]